MHEDYYISLIRKELDHSISSLELEELEKWKGLSKKNEQTVIEIEEVWKKSNDYGNDIEINAEEEWQLLDKRIKSIRIGRNKIIRLVAVAASVFLVISMWFFSRGNNNQVVIAENNNQLIELTDGSKIRLRKGSRLEYSNNKNGNREVNLIGQAFMDIAKDDKRKFFIKSPDIEVEVLGTKFFIDDSVSDGSAEIQLVEGSIAANSDLMSERVILKAGETFLLSKSNVTIESQLHLSKNPWFKYDLNFRAIKLKEVLIKLGHFYGVDIAYSDNLNDCLFNGNLNDISLEQALENMAMIYSSQLNIIDGKYEMIGGKCQ